MPEYRKLHARAGHSEKVSSLTDFEHRVWIQMRSSADDLGVGPTIAGRLQGDNRALASRPVKAVERAMRRVIESGLFETFVHQRQEFYFQPDWQEFEDIRYPKDSSYPRPPREKVSALTLKLCDDLSERLREKGKNVPEKKGAHGYAYAGALENPNPNPDPSPDLDLSLEKQPSPLKAIAPARRQMPSLLGLSPIEFDRKHGAVHVVEFCDFVCFPNDLADSFANKVTGTPFPEARGQVLLWARSVRQTWHGRIVPDGNDYEFWRHQWTATHGGSKPTTNSAAPDPLAGIRKGAGRG